MTLSRTRRTFLPHLGALACLAGCFGPPALKYDMIPVEGTITLEGDPLVAAEVMFDSADGPRGFGTTDDSGRFTVTTRQFGAGLPAGTYRVMIAGSEQTRVAPSGRPVKLSPRYRESGVGKATIAAGAGPLIFDLKKTAGAADVEAGGTAEP